MSEQEFWSAVGKKHKFEELDLVAWMLARAGLPVKPRTFRRLLVLAGVADCDFPFKPVPICQRWFVKRRSMWTGKDHYLFNTGYLYELALVLWEYLGKRPWREL